MSSPIFTEQNLLQSLHLLICSARIYRDNNKVLVSAVERFLSFIPHFCQENDELTLLLSEGSFYLNQEKIVFDRLAASFSVLMLKFFEERHIEGLRFHDSISQASFYDVTHFFRLLDDAVRQEDPVAWLEEKIGENNLSWVEHVRVSMVSLTDNQISGKRTSRVPSAEAEPGKDETVTGGDGAGAGNGKAGGRDGGAGPMQTKQRAIQTYGYAVYSLREVTQRITGDKRASIRKMVRLVHNMIDMVVDDNPMFLSLSTIRDYDDYTYTHSMNVAILSLCIGNKIALPRRSLETLSLAALFHDLGKIDVPREILNKPGPLNDQELQVMKKHSLDSVRRIIRLKTNRQKKASLLLPPFEHHLKYDLSGYPKTPRRKPLSLFGRIICIADVFDALTAPRIYRPVAWSPDRALGFMLERSGKDFDPLLLKVFINMIGIFPIGTLLRLDNDEMGLVSRYAEGKDGTKELWLQLILPVEGGGFRKGESISLGYWDPAISSFARPVLESLHPSVYGIQPAEFLL